MTWRADFDVDLFGEQRALELLPRQRVHQQLVGVDDQVTAVGPVQCARPDEVEVGDQRAELGQVLDLADQPVERGVVFVDHRGAVDLGVVDEDVDLIAAKRHLRGLLGVGLLALPGGQRGLAEAGGIGLAAQRDQSVMLGAPGEHEILGVLDDVVGELAQVLDDVGDVGVVVA